MNIKKSVLGPFSGKKHTAEARARMSESHSGRTHTQETRQKISLSLRQGNKQVKCVETGKVYESVTNAAKIHDTTKQGISRACHGVVNTSNSLHWSYL